MSQRKLIGSVVAGSIVLFSLGCGENNYNLEVKNVTLENLKPLSGDESVFLRSIVKSIFPSEWKILNIYEAGKEDNINSKRYLLEIYIPNLHLIRRNFIWLTFDNKTLITQLYHIEKGKVVLIKPQREVSYPLENLRWILDIERILITANFPTEIISQGNKTLYLVWNIYCKACYSQWKQLLKYAKEKGFRLKIIPFHSFYYPQDNLYSLIYILWKAQNVGSLEEVLKEYYSSASNFEEFLKRIKTNAYGNLTKINPKTFNEIGFYLEQLGKVLNQAKIFVVPTSIEVVKVSPNIGVAEGYIYIGKLLPEK